MLKKWWNGNKTTEEVMSRLEQVKAGEVPEHIAIIMDGNGRWAKKRHLPRVAGHREGMKTVQRVTKIASRLGVKVLTMYAFSTENWKRPSKEVEFLMKLPNDFLHTYLPELIEENVKVEMIGHSDRLPAHTKRAIEEAMEKTAHNDGLILNFALNYGGRAELVEMTKKIAEEVASGTLEPSTIDEEVVNKYMMTAHLPDPDLLIRTSGELRLSNFLLWQLAYAEFIFTDVYWPDFTEEHFIHTIEEYQQRHRRFGSVEGGTK